MKILLSILFVTSSVIVLCSYIDFIKHIKSITDKVLDDNTVKKTKRKTIIWLCCNITAIFIGFFILIYKHF